MFRGGLRFVLLCGAVGLACVVASDAQAQLKFDRGQNVAPVFEGWERNPDGTFNMVFGYMNRNYREMPHVPVGPDNFFEPGPADRGQPTRFHVRRQQFVFRVQVPADWGDKDLVWTLTAHGRTDQAFGSLWRDWELDDGVIKANRGMGANGWPADNQWPYIEVEPGTDLEVTLPDTPDADGARERRRDSGAPSQADEPGADSRRRRSAGRARTRSTRRWSTRSRRGRPGLAVTWAPLPRTGPGDVRPGGHAHRRRAGRRGGDHRHLLRAGGPRAPRPRRRHDQDHADRRDGHRQLTDARENHLGAIRGGAIRSRRFGVAASFSGSFAEGEDT